VLADLPHPVRVAAGQRTERARAREREREKETIIYARPFACSLVLLFCFSLAVCRSLAPSLHPSLPPPSHPSLPATDTQKNRHVGVLQRQHGLYYLLFLLSCFFTCQ